MGYPWPSIEDIGHEIDAENAVESQEKFKYSRIQRLESTLFRQNIKDIKPLYDKCVEATNNFCWYNMATRKTSLRGFGATCLTCSKTLWVSWRMQDENDASKDDELQPKRKMILHFFGIKPSTTRAK